MKFSEAIRINEIVEEKTRNLQEVNYIRYLGVEEEKKCAVVCQYFEGQRADQYYGLHPNVSPEFLLSHISMGELSSEESLASFMSQYSNYFEINNSNESDRMALFAMTLLRMASQFGITVSCSKEDIKDLISCLERRQDIFVNDVTYKILDSKNDSSLDKIAFLGGITSEASDYLDNCGFALKMETNDNVIQIVKTLKEYTHKWQQFYELISDLKSQEIFRLCTGKVYYSGVLPRVIKVERFGLYSNPSVQIIKLLVEKTTYATCDAFNNGSIMQHPLLKKYKTALIDFFKKEDETQNLLFTSGKGDNEFIEAMNKYLSLSRDTNTVAVSGNITLKDDTLLIVKRNPDAIDGNSYYCAVNGQSEFKDANVQFYFSCVDEDSPTMEAKCKVRNDFSKELDRETLAELNIDNLKNNWRYHGIAIMGIHNFQFDPYNSRRMQFNVLAYNVTDNDFLSLVDWREQATEKFENKTLEGIKISLHDNIVTLGWAWMKSFFKLIKEHEIVLNYALGFVFVLLIGFADGFEVNTCLEKCRFGITFAFASIILISGILSLLENLKNSMRKKNIFHKHNIFRKKATMDDVENIVTRLLSHFELHPIAIMMLALHYQKYIDDMKKEKQDLA